MEQSKFMRFIWNFNGIGLFIAIVLAILSLTMLIWSQISIGGSREYNEGAIVQKIDDSLKVDLDMQHLVYGDPQKIYGSDFFYVPVYVLDKDIPEETFDLIRKANDMRMNLFGGSINVIFFRDDMSKVYPLLDDFVFIETMDLPSKYANTKTNRNYIFYSLVFKDSNNDGRINSKDRKDFFISDLNGKNLKRINPSDVSLDKYWISDENPNSIFLMKVEKLSEKDQYGVILKKHILYHYDVALSRFIKFDKLEEEFTKLTEKFKSQL